MNSLDYGVIGNCRSAAIVSKYGSIDWLCLPDFDSPSVFAKLLDAEKGGSFYIQVAEDYKITQEYVQGTNILKTRYESREGTFDLFDFMPRYRTSDNGYYISPEVYRYIRLVNGKPKFKVFYDPRMNYAKDKTVHKIFKDYVRTSSQENDKDNIYLYSDIDFDTILENREIELVSNMFLLLAYNQKLVTIDIQRISLEYQRTKVYWLNWNNRSKKFTDYNEQISRSLLVLKLMSFQSSGAVLAALTTSVPETIGEVRNWDYRFCWIRDASMSIETLLKMGHPSLALRFLGFIKRIVKSKYDEFQIMYGIRGERKLTEEILPHLSGYQNSYPVRIGNAAYNQKQNDSLGYLMDVVYNYYRYFQGNLDEVEEMWEIVRNIVKTVIADWKNEDQSIWEFRNIRAHFVFSKVMCWVALDRAARIAELINKNAYANQIRTEADIIREDILENGWNEKLQSFTQAYGNEYMDSSLLLMEQYGFIEPTDERFVKTVRRVKDELFYGGLMYRYKIPDDFGEPSSSFTICTFWMVRALYVIGEIDEALTLFDNLLGYSNHLGLFSEDLNFESKQQLGNFPQAYSHLALINTASLFSEERSLSSRFIRP